MYFFFFFFNDTATTEIYTLSLHDALPICVPVPKGGVAYSADQAVYRATEIGASRWVVKTQIHSGARGKAGGIKLCTSDRSEEHTSELQSRLHLVCRLLLEKKKKKNQINKQ